MSCAKYYLAWFQPDPNLFGTLIFRTEPKVCQSRAKQHLARLFEYLALFYPLPNTLFSCSESLPTKGDNKYFITFIDDCTKYCYVYLLKSKDEAIDKFVLYKNEVENQLGKKIKVVRSDIGDEYVSPFAEEMVTAMLISSGMSQDMWGEAILTATYLLNKIPHKEKEETPYELWMRQKPSYQYLRVWGCLAKVAVPIPKAQKIRPKSVDCIFIGYAKNSSAYRFIRHESKNPYIQKNTVMESRNASFFENIFPWYYKETGSSS
ncbi:retrotransposon protein, putative, ty1-copia subclass [Tanacetum coccineum]